MTKYARAVLWSFLGIIIAICFVFAAMQTKGFKKMVLETLTTSAKDAGITLTIGSVEGHLPFRWTLNDVHFELTPTDILEAKKVNLRLAILPLLRKEISISYMSLLNSRILYSEETTNFPPLSAFSLPFSLSVRSFKMENVEVENFETKEKGIFTFKAKAKLKKWARFFLVDARLISSDTSNSFARFYLKGSQRVGKVQSLLHIRAKSLKAFQPFLHPAFDTEGEAITQLEGDWKTWKSLFVTEIPTAGEPLSGKINGRLARLEIPKAKVLNRRWKLDSAFLLSTDRSFDILGLALQSNILTLNSKAHFDSQHHLKNGTCEFALPQLSLFNLYSRVPLQGQLTGKAEYTPTSALFEISGDNISIGTQKYEVIAAQVKSHLNEGQWQGRAEFLGKNKLIPIEGQSEVFLKDDELTFKDFYLTAADAKLAGNIAIDLSKQKTPSKTYGSLFAQIPSLARFQPWAPAHSDLEGSVGAEAFFNGDLFHTHILVKNFHYFKTLANELSLDLDLFEGVKGKLSIEGEQLYLPQFYLSSFALNTKWDGERGPYDLFVRGDWKEPLSIESTGFWTTRSLNIETLNGTLLKQNFALEKPFFIEKGINDFKISDCEIQFGSGHLSLALDLGEHFSKGRLNATHFPLDFFLISHPAFSLSGSTTVDAQIEGENSNLQGRFNLLLEHFDLYQSGKPSPVMAKGSIDAYLNQNTFQVQADLRASNDQFFSLKSTLPVEYTLMPFKVKVDPHKPLSGEMIFEGKLEEIFDFINIGSHRASGLISSHLFLSKTLQNPSLQGKLELQKGSYENYYTGTLLKEIDAQLEAKGDYVVLSSLEAKDNSSGKATATGNLFLNSDERFPYSVNAELTNLNLLKLDSMTANFSGPLFITGNKDQALATGTLTLPSADLSIPDEIPPDLPVLPFKFVNRPAHLDASIVQPLPIFPFNLDLDLSAPGPVYLRGRGLRSEWKGNVHVTGTNADIAAKGNLTLTKGEFIFSGKVFNLTNGEITLSDKPSTSAYINLRGELQLSDLMVTAFLSGPLNSPLLTFQSTPYLPTSSILSRILFNKDVSEIDALQAIQLAQAIVTISGGAGPDVLERIRKTIGVDRLNIVSGVNDTDEVSVQIGKYLTKGLMITLSQGVDTSNVMIEVELKHGFLFQAESQEEGEGKFTLKWNKNY